MRGKWKRRRNQPEERREGRMREERCGWEFSALSLIRGNHICLAWPFLIITPVKDGTTNQELGTLVRTIEFSVV